METSMNESHILYLNQNSKISGAEISLFNLIRRLPSEKFKPIVVCPSKGLYVNKLSQEGIPVEIIEMQGLRRSWNPIFHLKLLGSLISFTIKIIRFMKRERIDLVHANSFGAGIYGSIAAKLTRVPIIWHVRDIIRRGPVRKFLVYLAGRLADRIIVVSKATAAIFTYSSSKRLNKVIMIYNGIDLKEFNFKEDDSNVRKEHNIDSNAWVIGMVGQLAPWKGHRLFLKTAKRLLNYSQNLKFLIVGDVIYKQNTVYKQKLMEETESLGLADHLIFTGFRDDILQVMTSLDILVHPSIRPDPLPRAILEAMAMAKPVIATRVGGIPEIVVDGKTGILVEPNNLTELAEAIEFLLKNPERTREMGMAGRKRVENFFNIDKHVKEMENEYANLLK